MNKTRKMDKEFISYKQALALKELGFDEPCLRWFDERFGDDLQQHRTCSNSDLFMTEKDCAAPLYQQAFRWFRDKHDITVSTLRNRKYKSIKRYEARIDDEEMFKKPKKNMPCMYFLDYCDTYEEVEQKAIEHLIQIINVRQKKT